MATINVRQCGCGFVTTERLEMQRHKDETGHKGLLWGTKAKLRGIKALPGAFFLGSSEVKCCCGFVNSESLEMQRHKDETGHNGILWGIKNWLRRIMAYLRENVSAEFKSGWRGPI